MVDTDSVTQGQTAEAGRDRSEIRRQAVVAGTIAGALTVLGVPVGLVWSAIAPRAVLVVVEHGQAVLADPESTAYITGDGSFALLTMGVGAVAAVVAYALAGRRSGTGAALGLAAGGVLGALVAWQTGRLPAVGDYRQALHGTRVGDQISALLTVHARGVLVLGALAAVALFGLIEVCVSMRDRPAQPSALTGPFAEDGPDRRAR